MPQSHGQWFHIMCTAPRLCVNTLFIKKQGKSIDTYCSSYEAEA
jgi:hypothetical protein